MPDKIKRPAKALNNSVSSTPIKPSAKQVNINDEDETDLKKIYDLMAQMNSKLDKLDQIEIHLAQVDQDIKDLKHSYTFVNETADELKKMQAVQDSSNKSLEESIANTTCVTPYEQHSTAAALRQFTFLVVQRLNIAKAVLVSPSSSQHKILYTAKALQNFSRVEH